MKNDNPARLRLYFGGHSSVDTEDAWTRFFPTTTAQVLQASNRYLAPEKMTVLVVGEDKVVREQFAPFSIPVVDVPIPLGGINERTSKQEKLS